MGNTKKIPTKNRKKLKYSFIQSQNPQAKVIIKKKRNWDPKQDDLNDQPVPKTLLDIQESSKLIGKKQVKQRKVHKSRVLAEAEKIGMTKGRFESIEQFIRRVERSTRGCFDEHKINIAQGTAGRAQEEIDADYKSIEDAEKRQKDQKKREIQNQITKARKEREEKAKRIQEKLEEKKRRRLERTVQEEVEEEDAADNNEQEEVDDEEEEDDSLLEPAPFVKTSQKNAKKAAKKKEEKLVEAQHQKTDAILNSREVIRFGERNDEPPKFAGAFKKSLEPLMAKAGGKTLLLHSIMQKETGVKTTYMENDNVKEDKEAERLRVIEAYRDMKRARRVAQ